jgi:multicomponent K+:H+ antiporter subunit F
MTGHMFIDGTLAVCMHVVALAMLLALWRLVRGPTAPDRILALDTLYVATIAQVVLLGMLDETEVYFEIALIIAMLGFFGTVVLSKYVIRRDIVE